MSGASSLDWLAGPAGPLRGELVVPGDKSVSHRAVMLGAIAEGVTRVRGFLEGEDTRATARILGQLGARIEAPAASERIVHGVGLHGLRGCADDLDCGNAGTGMRLLAGLLAGQVFDSRLVGDASLSRRPMGRVIEPLARMGARIEAAEGGRPPLIIHGNNALQGIDYEMPVASAQVKSALLLAGLYARGETRVREPHPTRDYTERMLAAFGWPVAFRPGEAALSGGQRLRATEVVVPADFSSAAFFLVAATLVPGSELRLRAVGINPRRTGLLHALRAMGADIRVENAGEQGGEPVADLVVRHAPLRGIEIDTAWVPDMIDEFPVLFVAAACARGRTVVRGAAELRVKESDRIAAMAEGLRALGIAVEERPDGAVIEGGRLRGGAVDSRGDHRIAMSFVVAAQLAGDQVRIGDCANVATSFPGFEALARGAGMGVRRAG
ncbi:3-phosphoshikimate 1-carboxyvinyltransferase [Rehaibacterium terrae]|jgi:3-phosphoshikimate 1-carboxyvinyltransferase|uniref:3-phosphoshikimate 1-carboxyvinyltransferase n=1 Tax=Rehaibacterium terrae TaxID=1341696 RepID=A0A7W7XYQ4_9GAMM|nr:3-phosphoshikimate 1-carboxyvinyltransferase [Rehaibacterium terrae]MBB5014892.1 3-phosphoshikimate 1-carboxyvinyltransferase [Rehaibacterium terrae]